MVTHDCKQWMIAGPLPRPAHRNCSNSLAPDYSFLSQLNLRNSICAVLLAGLFGATVMERVMGIEPTSKAWEAFVLPLNYTRISAVSTSLSKQPSGDQILAYPILAQPRLARLACQLNGHLAPDMRFTRQPTQMMRRHRDQCAHKVVREAHGTPR